MSKINREDEKLILLGTHGTYIHSLRFNPIERTLRLVNSFKTGPDASWLTAHPTLPDVIYANSRDENKIYALRLNREDDSLEATSEGSTGEGGGPCHIAFHPKAGLIIANYASGKVTSLPLSSTGQITSSTPSSIFTPQDNFTSLSAEPDYTQHPRQNGPHAHQIVIHPESGDVFVPDLGSNVVWRLRWDEERGELRPIERGHLEGFEKGDGPRHLVFHPDGHHVYTLTELASTLVIHSLLEPSRVISRHSILPEHDQPGNTSDAQMLAGEIIILPHNSAFTSEGSLLVICSNRDSTSQSGDALTLFSADKEDGNVTNQQFVFGAGKHIRGVTPDREGRWVCTASKSEGGVKVFQRSVGHSGPDQVVGLEGLDRPACPLWTE